MTPVALGIVAGLAASGGSNRLLQSQLVGVSSFDPATIIGGLLLLTVVALMACGVPARRAIHVNPRHAPHTIPHCRSVVAQPSLCFANVAAGSASAFHVPLDVFAGEASTISPRRADDSASRGLRRRRLRASAFRASANEVVDVRGVPSPTIF